MTAKRQNTTHHNEPVGGDTSGTHGYHTTTSTSYCVAFDVESGDQMEFSVYGEEYGMLAEGDEGKLTFQEAVIWDSRGLLKIRSRISSL